MSNFCEIKFKWELRQYYNHFDLNLLSRLYRNEVYCSVQIDKVDETEKNIKPKDKNDNPVSNFII